jgi:hypothetical protein
LFRQRAELLPAGAYLLVLGPQVGRQLACLDGDADKRASPSGDDGNEAAEVGGFIAAR